MEYLVLKYSGKLLLKAKRKLMKKLKAAYIKKFATPQEEDDEESKGIKSIMAGFLTEDETEIDEDAVSEDTQELLAATEDHEQFGEVFQTLIRGRNLSHLRAVFNEYKEQSEGNVGIEEVIADQMPEEMREGSLAVVKLILDPMEFLSEKLKEFGGGDDEDDDDENEEEEEEIVDEDEEPAEEDEEPEPDEEEPTCEAEEE